MNKWIEYDPKSGIRETTYASDDDDGKIIVTKEQNVEGLLNRNAELRNTGATDKGIKKGLWHYASIPLTVQYELLKKGINIFRQTDWKRLYDEINQNYPWLKTTDKHHSISRRSRKPSDSASEESSTKPGRSLIVP